MTAFARACVIAAVLVAFVPPLGAQQGVGRTMQLLPPFSDPELHRRMEDILLQMDAFHGDAALRMINEALPRARHDAEARCYLLSYRAEVLYYEGLFNEAMRDLDECGALAEGLADSTLMANVFNMKGLLHENIQDNRLALPYLRAALRLFPRRPAARYPVTELHHIHGNLGTYLTSLGEHDSAEWHLRRSLALAEEAGVGRAVAVAWWGLGNLALARGRPDHARDVFERSFAVATEHADHDIGVDALVGRARALATGGQREEALHALERARGYLIEHRSGIGLVTQRNFARVASATLRQLGDAQGALADLADWHRIDSTITARNIRSGLAAQAELLRADNDLEVERLERQRIAAELDRARAVRLFILAFGGLLLVVIVAIFLLVSGRQKARRRLVESELLRERQDRTIAELRVREQVGRDLHDDLGVGLSGLKLRSEMALLPGSRIDREELLREHARKAEELIASMRHIIWALQDDQGDLADLVAYINNHARSYLSEHRIPLVVEAEGPWPSLAVGTTERRNCFLVVKEALHNIVKHAGASRVTLGLRWQEGLIIDVIDDGRGMAGMNGQSGHGLPNMRKRMAVIGGVVVQVPAGRGTHLRFTMPLGQRKLA